MLAAVLGFALPGNSCTGSADWEIYDLNCPYRAIRAVLEKKMKLALL
ncbi:hypothetical protein NXH64_03850 [Butyrivibrio fibrisolvens]|nr:hypothetical protein [Butyrivibrio fibrisolvens]